MFGRLMADILNNADRLTSDKAVALETDRTVTELESNAPEDQRLDVTEDAFLGGAVHVQQPAAGYRAGLDAVLLAASVPHPPSVAANRPYRLLDVGAGAGVVGLCAAVRLPALDVTFVEQSPALCELAERNIELNGLSGRARVIEDDILQPAKLSAGQLPDNSFDVVVSNPPFYEASNHRQSPHALKAASHAMPDAGLDRWVRYMARMTRHGGTAIIIHRADQLPVLLAAVMSRFGAITVTPLHPRRRECASRIIISGIKGSRAPLRLAPGICLHGSGNAFLPAIDQILKSPLPLLGEGGT